MVAITYAPASARDRSRHQALEHLRRSGGCTRTELMAVVGLSRSGVAHLIAQLVESGEVIETEAPQREDRRRGRPSSFIMLRGSGSLAVGVDLGHGHISVALAEMSGNILGEKTRRHDVDSDACGAVRIARALMDELTEEFGQGRAVTNAVVGVPGPVDSRSQLVRAPTILAGWVGINPKELLREGLGVPIGIEHDTFLGAYGEKLRGAGRGLEDFIYVKASGGIGAGLVLSGEAYRGWNGLAGEIGHTKVPGTSELCRCGGRGCLESLVSVDALRTQLGIASGQSRDEEESFANVVDAMGIRILSEAGWILGRVLSDLCNCLSPQAVILGGSLGSTAPTMLEGVRASIQRYAQPAVVDGLSVVHAESGVRAELIGAVLSAVERASRL